MTVLQSQGQNSATSTSTTTAGAGDLGRSLFGSATARGWDATGQQSGVLHEGRGLCTVSSLLRHVSVKTSETLARAGPRGGLVVLEARVDRWNAAWWGVGVHDADINPAPAMRAGEKPQHSNDSRWAC